MDIKYFKNGVNTIAVGDYSDEEGRIPGVPDLVYYDMQYSNNQCLTSRERQTLANITKLTSRATLAEGDNYDAVIGQGIARDKLIIKDAERAQAKYEIVVKYLTRLLDDIKIRMQKNEDRMNRAYDRLSAYETYSD